MSSDVELLAAIARDARLLVEVLAKFERARQGIETITDRMRERYDRLSMVEGDQWCCRGLPAGMVGEEGA